MGPGHVLYPARTGSTGRVYADGVDDKEWMEDVTESNHKSSRTKLAISKVQGPT